MHYQTIQYARGTLRHAAQHYNNYNALSWAQATPLNEIYTKASPWCNPLTIDSIEDYDHLYVLDSSGEVRRMPKENFQVELVKYKLVIINNDESAIYHKSMLRSNCVLVDGLYYTTTMAKDYEWYQMLNGTLENHSLGDIYSQLPLFFLKQLFNRSEPVMVNDIYYHRDSDSIRYCEHYEEHFDEHVCVWNEDNDCYYHQDVAPDMDQERCTSNQQRAYINDYHRGPAPRDYSDTPSVRTDVKGLDKFTIGFEVEKKNIMGKWRCGDSCEEQPLFSHWETDSSCGVEGVTNIYNLGDFDTFQRHVISSNYVDEPTTYDCGGHTNVAFKESDICDYQINLEDISKFVGPIYSMYKKRLRNTYSSYNKKLSADNSERYGAIVMKRNPERVEFRLPSRINNKQQLLRRFKLFQHLFSHIYNYKENTEEYMETMNIVNSRLDVEFGKRTLYREFKYDKCFRTEFYSSSLYKKVRFLLWDIKDFLEPAYKNRMVDLKIMLINSYQFQAWLDDDPTVNLTSILQYLRQRESEGPHHLLTDAQRNWTQNQQSYDIYDDLNNLDAMDVPHSNTTETTEV